MLLEELLRDERREAEKIGELKAMKSSIISLLEELGEIPEELRGEVERLDNLELLKVLVKKSARTESAEAFNSEMRGLVEIMKGK